MCSFEGGGGQRAQGRSNVTCNIFLHRLVEFHPNNSRTHLPSYSLLSRAIYTQEAERATM